MYFKVRFHSEVTLAMDLLSLLSIARGSGPQLGLRECRSWR